MYAIQRDGSKHNDDWTPYVQETVDLTGEWKTITKEFQMTEDTDPESVLSLSMGAVGGVQITEQHRICIDDINLEKIEAPATTPAPDVPTSTPAPDLPKTTPAPDVPAATPTPGAPENPADGNLLKNGDFASGKDSWIEAITEPGAASVSYKDKKAVFDITNVGTEDWNVQFKQEGITLEKGSTYTVKFKATSTAARTIMLAMMSTDGNYTWYGGEEEIALEAGKEKEATVTFTMTKDTDTSAALFLSMGKIKGKDTPASIITLSDFSLVKAQ